jgi:hypothetical protein
MVHKCQTISGENLENNGLGFLSLSYQKQKDEKREKVLSVKKNIYKRKRHEIRRVLTEKFFCLRKD